MMKLLRNIGHDEVSSLLLLLINERVALTRFQLYNTTNNNYLLLLHDVAHILNILITAVID